MRRLPSRCKRTTGTWLAIAALCAGCASTPPPHSGAHDGALRAHMQQLASLHGICDAAVAVVRQRVLQSVETAHGCAAPSIPVSAQDDVFEAASLSKPLFAYAVLKLVQQGKMDLDAPIAGYLPDGYAHRHFPYLADSPVDQVSAAALAGMTVRMALNHTSGLPNWAGGPLVVDRQPGGAWRYSGEGYVLLQRAVEAVTGEDLGAYMRRTVFVPLGMAHSAYTRRPELERFIVPGADERGAVLTPTPFRDPIAAFSLYTTAADYGRFLAALLNDEPVLRQIAAAPVPMDAKLGLAWGLGWGLERRQDEVFLWHWGSNNGYRAFAMVSPRTGDGFVMFTNSDNGMLLARSVGERILPGKHPVYRSPKLRDGLGGLLCAKFDVCG